MNIGLQIEGVAEKLDGDILELAIKHRLKRGKAVPKKRRRNFRSGRIMVQIKT